MGSKKFIFIAFCLCGYMVSCGTADRLVKSHNIANAANNGNTLPPPIIKLVHDTIIVNGKHMTPEQYQAYLQKFYEGNYNKLISPEFKRIAEDNKQLSDALSLMSGQMTFIITEDKGLRSRTRHYKDSIQTDNSYWKGQAIKNALENAKNLKLAADNSKESLRTSIDIVKILLAVTVVIILTLIFVYRKVSKLGRKVEALEKTLLTHE